METLLGKISEFSFEEFVEEWEKQKEQFDENQKQELISQIIAFHYDDKEFPFFRKVLDLIIDQDFNLNFNIEHWAPTILCLAVHVVSQNLFDYFISKGADINFIGDPYALEDDDYVRSELKLEDRRYATCLDFALMKQSELMTSDYHYERPDWTGIDTPWAEIDPSEEMTMSKRYYAYILEQAQYLYDVIHLNNLIDHIKQSGGKSYRELNVG